MSYAYSGTAIVAVGQQSISIPSLPTLTDMRANARVMEWGGALIEPSARLLAIFVEKDSPGVRDLTIDRYITIKTPKKWEQASLTRKDFQDLKAVLRKSTANLTGLSELANSRVAGQEQQISKALNAQMERMSVGAPVLIEVQRDDEHGYGYTYAARYQASIEGKSRTWVSASCGSTLLLKGKLLIINIFSLYRNASDIQWVRNTCREFVNGVVSDN